MVNKYTAGKCKTDYKSNDYQSKDITAFLFPIKKLDLNKQWNRFVNRITREPVQHFVLCEFNFEEHFICRTQRCNLKWQLNPVTTAYSAELFKSSSSL